MRQVVRDFTVFLVAVLTYWQASAPATFITGVVGVIEKIREKSLSKRAYLVIFLGAYLFFGVFLVWRDENTARREAETKLSDASNQLETEKKKNSPDIQGEIQYVGFATLANDPDVTSVTMIVTISNLGTPSIVDKYMLSMDVPGKGHITAVPTHPVNGMTIRDDDGTTRIFDPQDAIYVKTVTQPIPTGGKVEGMLLFLLRNITQSDTHASGQTVALTCEDVLKKKTTIKFVGDPLEKGPGYFPGMKMKTLVPKTKPLAKRQ